MRTKAKNTSAQHTALRTIDYSRLAIWSPVTITMLFLTATALVETAALILQSTLLFQINAGLVALFACTMILRRNTLSATVLAARIEQSALLVDSAMREAIRTGRKAHAGEGWWVSMKQDPDGAHTVHADRVPHRGVSLALFGLSTQGRIGRAAVLSLIVGVLASLVQVPADLGFAAMHTWMQICAYASNALIVLGAGLAAYGSHRNVPLGKGGKLKTPVLNQRANPFLAGSPAQERSFHTEMGSREPLKAS